MHLLMVHKDGARLAFLGSECHSWGTTLEKALSLVTTSLALAQEDSDLNGHAHSQWRRRFFHITEDVSISPFSRTTAPPHFHSSLTKQNPTVRIILRGGRGSWLFSCGSPIVSNYIYRFQSSEVVMCCRRVNAVLMFPVLILKVAPLGWQVERMLLRVGT